MPFLDWVHNYDLFFSASETNLIVNINDSVNFKCPSGEKIKVYMVSQIQFQNCEIYEGKYILLSWLRVW